MGAKAARIQLKSLPVLPPGYLSLHERYRCHIVLASLRALYSISSIPGRKLRFLGSTNKKGTLVCALFCTRAEERDTGRSSQDIKDIDKYIKPLIELMNRYRSGT
jgi:hypothetical protein